ncbi:Bicoid-interacting protein 3-domain-containing protein [Gongronella butleri]|nr:Bicoid-interacting protein 3-domain-containing protein [Gongronella butleri]
MSDPPAHNPYLSDPDVRGRGRGRGRSISLRGLRRPHQKSRPYGAHAQRPPPNKKKPAPMPARYGNYHNYYKSRRNTASTVDPRLAALDRDLFKDKKVLDIGCNSGNISILIAREMHPQHVLGVDLDEQLIQFANSNLRLANSLKPPADKAASLPANMDILLRSHYFPRALAVTHGNLPMRIPEGYQDRVFPFNCAFEACNWMDKATEEEAYDTILALSITKWIHLHGGDDGLKAFFQKIYASLKPGGVLVMEPQAYAGYAKRAKADPEMQAHFEQIQFMTEQYEDYLTNTVGFRSVKKLEQENVQSKGFDRELHVYTK